MTAACSDRGLLLWLLELALLPDTSQTAAAGWTASMVATAPRFVGCQI
jgi:hypothetical protein